MTQPSYAQYKTLSTSALSVVPESLQERLLTVLAVVASGQNPDGTAFTGGGGGGGGGGTGANKDAVLTPTITSGSAYAAGNVVGGVLNFGAISLGTSKAIGISVATLIDNSQQDAPIDLLLFNANPSNGTYTDHATPTYNATDGAFLRGVIPFSSYANIGTGGGVSNVPNVGLSVVTATTALYGLLITRGTPTYGSTTALTVALEYSAS